jgi:vacuolar-type H+-ATPase subunit H
MMDQIIKAILEAEEKANVGISEASMKAERMKDTIKVPKDELYDNKLAGCKEEAKKIRESAKKTASDESKKIMEECENELAELESHARKHMHKAVETIVKRILYGDVIT